jgi:serine/threonine protein kinase
VREKPNNLLGNRYQILEKVGEGGMAQVYRGMDVKLNRPVAIKILYEHLANDRDFLRRFKQEAKAAAKLSHPAIVNVYDEGEEEGLHYIVMEYVDGFTLKDIILREEHLKPEEAVRIALQICDALMHAHGQNVIHRDIKPHNIIVSPEGRVKVTDFGLARAATDATITYGKSLFGSVYYSSPEQARGSSADLKTDIYSLGIVLYEMLTGVVPFSGESPISIALKHLQEEIVPPGNLVAGLSPALEMIVTRATRKERNLRYSNAAEFYSDLRGWLKNKGKGEHLSDSFLQRLKSYPSPREQAVTHREKQEEGPETPMKKKKQSKKYFVYGAIVVVLFLALFTGYKLLRNFLFVPEVAVPDLTGLSLEEAEKELSPLELKYTVVSNVHSDTVLPAHIVSQEPLPQRKVKKKREIELVLSLGPEYIEVPDLIERPEHEARLILKDAGLEMSLSHEYSDTVASGHIIRQDPGKDFQVARGETVRVVVSKGKKPVIMRDFQGQLLADAQEWLDHNGLVLRDSKEEYSSEFAPGEIVSQFPAAGETVQAGDPVDLVISKGKEPEAVQTYHIKVNPRVPAGRLIKIYVEDEEGSKVVFEGEYQGQEISVTGVGSGQVILMEFKGQEYRVIDIKPFP